jgi:hypothetical protein
VRQLSIYYRGAIVSCNYQCTYCPFAKTKDTAATLAADAVALVRFCDWAAEATDALRILFTPWGEALIRRHYREAMVRLSHMDHVSVAVQTNLSAPLGWLADGESDRLALWCTYHPSQVSRPTFLAACRELDDMGIRYSVGMVGLTEDLAEIEAMRAALPPSVYLWVNAYKRVEAYYTAEDYARLTRVDPLFALNATRHRSLGSWCRAGHSSFTVDAGGVMRRCHFVADPIGDLYQPDVLGAALKPRRCPNDTCGCYLGYAQLEPLALERIYGDNLLARIPLPHALDVTAAERALADLDRALPTLAVSSRL